MSTLGDKKLVFAYSGQGSQYYQMGRELYDADASFRAWMERGDAVIARVAGRSVLEVVYGSAPRHESFDDIRYTGLALFLIQHSLTRWLELAGVRPDVLLGYSLGELCAHVVAGSLGFEDAARLIAEQARALTRACAPAFMAALLGEPERLEALVRELPALHVACRNAREHWVVTAPPARLAEAKTRARALGVVLSVLPVRYGFHSSLVDALEPYQRALVPPALSAGRLEIVSAAYAACAPPPSADYVWNVMRRPIDLAATAAFVARRHGDVLYLDVGPSGTLSTLLKAHLPRDGGSEAHALLTPFSSQPSGLGRLRERLAPFTRRNEGGELRGGAADAA